MSGNPAPAVGQTWADHDPRSTYPTFVILAVEDKKALVQRGPRKVRIRLDRLALSGARGYSLVKDGRP